MEENKKYKVEIVDALKGNMTAKEKIAAKHYDDAISIEQDILIDIVNYVVLDVHNELNKDKDTDYVVLVMYDKDGTKYKTSSCSFISSLEDIFADLIGEDALEEVTTIKVVEKESKNFKGKGFYTAVLV